MVEERRKLYGGLLPGYPEEIGRWLWGLEEARSLTIRSVAGMDRRTLEWGGPRGDENSISTLLYHIAFIEVDWLYRDLHESEVPEDLKAEFPFPFSTNDHLTVVTGVSVEGHLARLERIRKVFLDDMATHSLESWRRPRKPPKEDYEVTPAWVVYHLIEHESGHAFQIRALKSRAERHFSVLA